MKYVSFVGMSNIGKTAWAGRLAARLKIPHINCDDLIEARLGSAVTGQGVAGLAQWLGFPYEERYARNSRNYLDLESVIMRETLARFQSEPLAQAIMCTTGSVIYCDQDILAALRAETRVVYLQASDAHVQALFETYMAVPKPVIWGKDFAPLADEDKGEALRRCYTDLLRHRAAQYEKVAHVTVPYEMHSGPDVDEEKMLGAIMGDS